MSKPIKQFSLEELEREFDSIGIKKFRYKQVISWLYRHAVTSFDGMTNLPKSLREQLEHEYPLRFPEVSTVQKSQDGTRKYLLQLDESTIVETVGIPSQEGRLTVCCSSQAGCAMGCSFCATGKNGLNRNLSVGEIVDQVSVVSNDFGMRVSNVVVMGQGEGFANYKNLMGALRIMNHPDLLDIGARRITVSTCGIIPRISDFGQEPEQFTLAVSLHAARQNVRDAIMPGVKSFDLVRLKKCLEKYVRDSGRRVTLEYALIKNTNDSQTDLESLVDFCNGILCHVNLIMLNQVDGSPFKPVNRNTLGHWVSELEKRGVNATTRLSRGQDIDGACGQLAQSILKPVLS